MTSESKDNDAAVAKVRPLNATQTKNLTRLVENDFNRLRSELKAFAQEQTEVRTAEIRKEASALRMEEISARLRGLIDTYNDDVRQIAAEANEFGITVKMPAINTTQVAVTDKRMTDKITSEVHRI